MGENNIGLIGLAVMGQNLSLNMANKGYRVGVYNRTFETTRRFMADRGEQAGLTAYQTLAQLTESLKSPKQIFLLVKAGSAVDAVIDELTPLLNPGDLVIDGGNSYYLDSERRFIEMRARGFRFMGVGVSGGEEGALKGPSMMAGGDREAYELTAPLFQAVAARWNGDPCVALMGSGGAGHLVKMVHNGIEYGDMQLIAETYDFLHRGLGLNHLELHQIFKEWNRTELSSYLMEITADILAVPDDRGQGTLLEAILDSAGQKGTGRWTVQTAMEMGTPVPTITAAVEARAISSHLDTRQRAASLLTGPSHALSAPTAKTVNQTRHALYAAKICSYAQGIALIRAADQHHGFGLDLVQPAKVWRAGCIIRSVFLDDLMAVLNDNPELDNLLLSPFFSRILNQTQEALRTIVSMAAGIGIPFPAMAASLSYYDALRTATLPANLIQAQRDYFGAHTYARRDREGIFHTNWTGRAGKAAR